MLAEIYTGACQRLGFRAINQIAFCDQHRPKRSIELINGDMDLCTLSVRKHDNPAIPARRLFQIKGQCDERIVATNRLVGRETLYRGSEHLPNQIKTRRENSVVAEAKPDLFRPSLLNW